MRKEHRPVRKKAESVNPTVSGAVMQRGSIIIIDQGKKNSKSRLSKNPINLFL